MSGQYLLDELQKLELMARANRPTEAVQPLAFFESLYSGAATRDQTATQRVYDVLRSSSPDTGTALYYIDYVCAPFCSDFGRCCMIQLRREWGRFSNFSFRTPQRRISAYPARPSG